jgi:YD repeat-containing protein
LAREVEIKEMPKYLSGRLWGSLGLAVLSLGSMCAIAQTGTVYTQPTFVYTFSLWTPVITTSPAATFAVAQAQVAAHQPQGETVTVMNLHASDFPGEQGVTLDGTPAFYRFDEQTCYSDTGQCITNHDWEVISTVPVCEPGSYSEYTNSPNPAEEIVCPIGLPAVTPPPICESFSCEGDPIFASNGEMVQTKTDYQGLPGLSFTRTYRSTSGYSASVLTQFFVFFTNSGDSTFGACYQSVWYYSPLQGTSCFPYISYTSGPNQYDLYTEDGRVIQFTGPVNAVTQNADINERVTQVTVNGVTEWQVNREDDSIELYSGTTGKILQKTLRGGEIITYQYSTASTPPTVAPGPGYLISQSDPFGHALSWTYNQLGQMAQMTDPAGGLYQYLYDAMGNLTSVTYPDTTVVQYKYNEPAYTGGANLPNAMTGIIDESTTRFATFTYNSNGTAASSQHAGGVDNYLFNYVSPGVSTTVTDPLGTNRTYQFQNVLSYAKDGSQSQPGVSGGTVTQSETRDTNGNVAAFTDFKGNVSCYALDLTRNLETVRVQGFAAGSTCPSNLASYTPASGTRQRKISTVWEAAWRQPHSITEASRVTSFTHDSLGNLLTRTITDTTVTPNVARTWTYTPDSYGRVIAFKGPRTDVDTTANYHFYPGTTGGQSGELDTVTDALGHVTTYNAYNGHGQPTQITDPNNVVTTLAYDARTRLTDRCVNGALPTCTGGEKTHFDYWPTGLLKKVTQPDGSYVQYTYNAAHQLTNVTDELNNQIKYTPDAMGNITRKIDMTHRTLSITCTPGKSTR